MAGRHGLAGSSAAQAAVAERTAPPERVVVPPQLFDQYFSLPVCVQDFDDQELIAPLAVETINFLCSKTVVHAVQFVIF